MREKFRETALVPERYFTHQNFSNDSQVFTQALTNLSDGCNRATFVNHS